jgi:hypothetical protein
MSTQLAPPLVVAKTCALGSPFRYPDTDRYAVFALAGSTSMWVIQRVGSPAVISVHDVPVLRVIQARPSSVPA